MTGPQAADQRGIHGDSGDSETEPTPGHRTLWTAPQLLNEQFDPPCWAVPGIIAEGLTLFAGPPKVGKSWLALGLAVSVASGRKALGKVEVTAGPVLYLALEDTPRRIQARLRKILGEHPAPKDLTVMTACPPLPQTGAAQIRAWLNQHSNARLVVIDVFARVRGATPPGTSAYGDDYTAVSRAKRIADDYGVAMVLVHHVRKQAADDFLAEVSGTNGLAGAADTVMVLKRSRGQADGALHVTGRDVDETDYALSFNAEHGAWQLLDGPAVEHLVSETAATILRYVRQHPGARPKQITEATGLTYNNVKRTCVRMVDRGQLSSDGKGSYSAPDAREHDGDTTSVTPVTDVSDAGQSPY